MCEIFFGFVCEQVPILNFMYMTELGPDVTIVKVGNSVSNSTDPKINYQMLQSYLYSNIVSTSFIFVLVTYMHKLILKS